MSNVNADLRSLGLNFDSWEDAVEAAIATNRLAVTGEVRGGQLIQYADPSGAQINILAVEPFATFVGFDAQSMSFAHVSMLNDVLALVDIIDYNDNRVATLTVNLAQGPLLVDEPEQRWQQIGLTALGRDVTSYANEEAYEQATGETAGALISHGAQRIGDPVTPPDAGATFSARVLEAELRTNALTGERFVHATVDGSFAFDVCYPATEPLPVKGSVIAGKALLVGSLIASQGCGSGGGGCGNGGCGCGGH